MFKSVEMKFLRSMAGFTPLDFKGNREIRNQLDQNVSNLNKEVEKRNKWYKRFNSGLK
jgi:hypothetical protein